MRHRLLTHIELCIATLSLLAVGGAPRLILKGEKETELAPHHHGNVYAPCLVREGKLWRMWYGGQGTDGHDRIHYAESRDGLSWQRLGVAFEDRQANHLNDPTVVQVKGQYYLYYTRTEKDVVDRIDVAISKDGKVWEKKGAALKPALGTAWDDLSVGRPAVIYEDGLFKLWYDGRKDFPPDAPVRDVPKSATSRRHVGYATSKDGLRFTRSTQEPVLGNDIGAVDVKRVGNQLVLVYESRLGTGLATSLDGKTWLDKGIVSGTSAEKLDAFGHVTPNLLIDANGGLQGIYVGAAAATTWDQNSIAVLSITSEKWQQFLKTKSPP